MLETVAVYKGGAHPIPKDALFCRYEEAGGNILVAPVGDGVLMYQHLEEDPETGALRIALTRLAGIAPKQEKKKGER
jgi:hypothetical protein